MFITILFKSGDHVSIPAGNVDTAREAVTAAHDAMNARRAFKVGDSATFSSEHVKAVYVSKQAVLPEEMQQSIFDVVFGRRR